MKSYHSCARKYREILTMRIKRTAVLQLRVAERYITGTKRIEFQTKTDITKQCVYRFHATLLCTNVVTVHSNEARLLAVSIIVRRNGSRRMPCILPAASLQTMIRSRTSKLAINVITMISPQPVGRTVKQIKNTGSISSVCNNRHL